VDKCKPPLPARGTDRHCLFWRCPWYARHIRPGNWIFSASQAPIGIAAFDQYEHLADIQNALKANKNLAAALGGDYIITPDIVIGRKPLSEAQINEPGEVLKGGLFQA